MSEIIYASYERKSTLWKNANYFYVLQDWVRMECGYCDRSEDRKSITDMGMRFINRKTNEDMTDEVVAKDYKDYYFIRLINKRNSNTKVFKFDTKDDANQGFKDILSDKVIKGWIRVS